MPENLSGQYIILPNFYGWEVHVGWISSVAHINFILLALVDISNFIVLALS